MRRVVVLLVSILMLAPVLTASPSEEPIAEALDPPLPTAALPDLGPLPAWAVDRSATGTDALPGKEWPQERPLPLPPGSRWTPRSPVDCVADCPPILVAPLDPDASHAPPSEESPRFDRSPYPADDIDGDSVEDLYLLPFIYLDEAAEEAEFHALSGADGSVLNVRSYEADWILPMGLMETDDGPIELIMVMEERFETQYEEWTVLFWSATLYAYDAGSGQVVWSAPQPASLEDDGSGSISSAYPFWGGRYLDEGTQALWYEGTYTWTDDLFHGDVTAEVSLIDPRTRSVHHTLAEDAWPHGRWLLDDAYDLYRLENDTVERRDGADNSLVWSYPTTHSLHHVEPVLVEHQPHLLLMGFGNHTTLSTIADDGLLRWSRTHDVGSFIYPVGTDADTGTTRLAYADLDLSCYFEGVPYTLGMIGLDTGDKVWEIEGDADELWVFTLASGDHDGDGIGDPAIVRLAYDGLISHRLEETCDFWFGLFFLPEYRVSVEVRSSQDGSRILSPEETAVQGNGFFIPILNYWAYDAPVHTVSYYSITWESLVVGWRLTSAFHVFDPNTRSRSEHVVDDRILDPTSSGRHTSTRAFPLRLFHGPLDTAFGGSWIETGGPDGHSRVAYFTFDLVESEQRWAFRSDSPRDVMIPH